MYALIFVLHLLNGSNVGIAIKYHDGFGACQAQAMRYHVALNRLPVTLGTESVCLPVKAEIAED